MLIERKLYSTGLKICDFLLENNLEGASSGLNTEQYVRLQKEKGFYNFIVKCRYNIAKDIFKEYKVPLSHVIILFAKLYPESFIKKLINMFDVQINDIPYNKLIDKTADSKEDKERRDLEQRAAMREFLTFFLKKRQELIQKMDDMSQQLRIQPPLDS